MNLKFLKSPNFIITTAILFLSVFLIFFYKSTAIFKSDHYDKTYEGEVVSVLSERDIEKNDVVYMSASKEQELLVKILDNGEEAKVINDYAPLKPGEKVYLRHTFFENDSSEANEFAADATKYGIVEISRKNGVIWLSAIFALIIFAVSGKRGFGAIVGLLFSFAVIFSFIVPKILDGSNPVVVSLIGSFFILIVTLYLSHGFNRKSLSALIGITITLLLVGIFAEFVINSMHFTGFAGEENVFLKQEVGKINLIGLLIAGIIIATVGVLDDISITQASTLFALYSANPSLSRWNLFRKAMSVGTDHISAVINTLVLAYTGAALPLVLLFSLREIQTGYLISIELVTEEIVRTLISSSGLVLAVPITTLIAAFLIKKGMKFEDHEGLVHAH